MSSAPSQFLLLLRRVLARLAWVLVVGLNPATSWAHDFISARAVWTDSSALASFELARIASYTPYDGVLSKGFGSQVQWVRLTVDGVPAGGPEGLILRIRPIFLDHITLFDPADPSAPGGRSTGDLSPLASAEFDSLHHAFVIPTKPVPRQIWLRLSTTSTQLLEVQALSPRDMQREEQALLLLYSGLLALLLSFLIWIFLAWLRDRDPVNGLFALRQLVLLVYTAGFLGYHRSMLAGLLSPVAQDLIYNWLVLATTALSLAFEYRLLSEYRLPRWCPVFLRALLGVSGLAVVLMASGFKIQALTLNTVINGLAASVFLSVALASRPPAPKLGQSATYQLPKPALISYYLLVAMVLFASSLPGIGWTRGHLVSLYAVLFYGFVSGLFMSSLMIIRTRRLELIRQQEANGLSLSRQALALETRRREDQSQLLNMLMHELKNPLAVIDLALKGRDASDKTQGYVSRAIDNMKGILERCVQTNHFIDRPFAQQRMRFDLARQLQQWLLDNKRAQGRYRLDLSIPSFVEADMQCVQIITGNLVENALHYGDPQEMIELNLRPKASADGTPGLCLQVANAPGAAGRPDPAKVFGKYYRSAGAQRLSGTGLGLFLSHNLAQQMSGELRYHPDPNTIRFELWLPT